MQKCAVVTKTSAPIGVTPLGNYDKTANQKNKKNICSFAPNVSNKNTNVKSHYISTN